VLAAITFAMMGCGGEDSSLRVADYLRSDDYRRLILEVDVTAGAQPEPGLVEEVRAQLEALVDKPDGVEVMIDQELAPRGPAYEWTAAGIVNLWEETSIRELPDGSLAIHTVFVDGFSEDRGTLGESRDHQHIVLFKDALCGVDRFADGCRVAEHFTWMHELGHVLGLVNNGAPMQVPHERSLGRHHCTEDDCIMGARLHRDDAVAAGEPPSFGPACHADLTAVRDLAPSP
jgi:hypothetical protein